MIVPLETELTDGVIRLRTFREEDIEMVYQAVLDSFEEISRWMSWCHAGYAREEMAGFIMSREEAWRNDAEYSFGVFDAATDEYLGNVSLNYLKREYQMANLGYWMRTSRTRRGAATRATRLCARFGLEQLGLQRIEIIAAVENLASQRVAEKAGARREGTLRRRLLIHDQPSDAVLFSLVAEDFQS